ncbi:unnamed protein product [Cuscuta epithymum]|uniref:C3H1-type domain-containing protein n=1 Tax=Cuscuta epithymum TaxID=186058 RepID=A0AAV0GGC6_9ASTE|nr:unnamed protein product [Cuscuta epithymum]
MGSECGGESYHKFHATHQLYLNKKYLRDPEIPPRKLFGRRHAADSDVLMESPPKAEDTHFQKFLPYNNSDNDDDDPYSSDSFRMFEFKVRRCTRSRSHDWTDCPFAHPGEKARRRDPRKYQYTGTVCSEFRKGNCLRGDGCEFSHGVFECWLHPNRYRTEACKDGKNCKRKVCFFAHTPRQLRVLPPEGHEMSPAAVVNHCCVCCHSPNSTLLGISHMSPPVSPSSHPSPISPAAKAPFSRFGGSDPVSVDPFDHKNSAAMTELVSNFESMNVNNGGNGNYYFNNNNNVEDQPEFILSPSTRASSKSISPAAAGAAGTTRFYNDSGLPGIDLGWVNDLLT